MNKKILFFCSCVLFVSCTDSLNNPIENALSVEELRDIYKKDTSFIAFYEKIQECHSSFFNEEINRIKYGEITYKRLFDFYNLTKDEDYINRLVNIADSEWKLQYEKYDYKLDSITSYWKEYKRKHDIYNYVSIELDSISHYYSYNGNKGSELGFYIKPLQGTIKNLEILYNVTSRDETDYLLLGGSSKILEIKTPQLVFCSVDNYLQEVLNNNTVDSFKKNYNFNMAVGSLVYNGELIENSKNKCPDLIELFLKEPEKYAQTVINKYIDEKFVGKEVFELQKINKDLEKKDKDCFYLLQTFGFFI